MRGKGLFTRFCFCHAGITPAYAGKSVFRVRLFLVTKDHPRLCGEKYFLYFMDEALYGSPPPMRGKACEMFFKKSGDGITPAYAGKRPVVAAVLNRVRDHPRLCGEKRSGGSTLSLVRGSPPPMRGKAMKLMLWQKAFRITPAYAGKRRFQKFNQLGFQDHPRLCGEKSPAFLPQVSDRGSPPPMRGKGGKPIFKAYDCRITPAYAGKSAKLLFNALPTPDHPRLCGEKIQPVHL